MGALLTLRGVRLEVFALRMGIVILALIMMAEETLETSLVIFGLTKSHTLRLGP